MRDRSEPSRFICPECGGTVKAGWMNVNSTRSDTPWSRVASRTVCAGCRRIVPAFLGDRWNGISPDEAREIWRTVFRADPQSGPEREQLGGRCSAPRTSHPPYSFSSSA